MKNVIKSFAALAASLLAFNACQQEMNPGESEKELYYVTFVAEDPATKTTVQEGQDENENKISVYSWTSSDATADRWKVYRGTDAATSVTPSLSDDVMTLTVGFSSPSVAGDKFVAVFNSGVEDVQNITKESVFDPTSDVLVSAPVAYAAGRDNYGFSFKRETAFARMTAKQLEGSKLIGASITADKVLAAGYDYENRSFEETGSKTITISANNPVSTGEAPVFFATVPVEDATLKVAVVTADENGDFKAAYEKSFTKTISFVRGDVHSFGTNLSDNKVTALTLDLSKDETTTAAPEMISWVRSFMSVTNTRGKNDKDEDGTACNNYYPGTSGQNYTSTRLYKYSTLAITPLLGVEIKSITFTATTAAYANALKKAEWSTNAYVGVDGTTVTVIPLDKDALTAILGDTSGLTKIEIELGKPNIAHATGVSLDQTSLSIDVEDTETLVATVTPDDAINKSVTWESSDNEIATVTNGVVRGISEGDATITVRTVDGGHTATCEVHVSSTSGKVYKWVKVSTLADLEDGGRYYLATNDGKKIFKGSITDGHLVTGTTDAVYADGKLTTIPEDATAIELTATSTANQYYIMYDGGYLHANAAKSGSFSKVNSSDFDSSKTNAWTFTVDNGTFDAVGSKNAAYLRSYSNGGFRSYANTNNGDRFVLYKRFEDMPSCAAPALTSGEAGEVNIGTVIYLTNNEVGSTIHYTVDGSDPTPSSTEYTDAGITINDDCTIKAAAFKANYNASPVLTLNYTVLVVATPAIEVNEGTGEVTLTCETDGATILYTVGEGDPETIYNADSKPVLSSGQTIKSKAIKDGYKDSAVATKKFVVRTLDRIEWTGYTVNYYVGDTFKKDGTVKAYYNDDTSEVVTEADGVEFSSPNMSTAADNVKVTVSYNGMNTEGTINVKTKALTVGYTFKAASLGSGYGTKTGVAKDAASNVTWTVTYGQGSYVGTNSSNKSNCKLGNTYAKVGTPIGYNANTTQVAAIISESKLDGVAKVVVSGDTDTYNPAKISLVYSTDGNTYSLIETQTYSKANGNTFTFAAKSEGYYALVLYYTGNSYMRTNNLKAEFYK